MPVVTTMGFAQPEWLTGCFKRKFRWKLIIPSISADGIFSLPPSKSARPNLTFKTMEAQHLNETIYYPAKPEWKPLQLTLYDMLKFDTNNVPLINPIFMWIYRVYDPTPDLCGRWNPALGDTNDQSTLASIKCAYAVLQLYGGCGELLEQWIFEHMWPESVDWGELDMGESGIVMCDVTLRYDRAYLDATWGANPTILTFPTFLTDACPATATTDINQPQAPFCANQPVDEEEDVPQDLVGPVPAVAPPIEPRRVPVGKNPPQQRRFMVKK